MIREDVAKQMTAFIIYKKRGVEEGERLYPEFLTEYLKYSDKTSLEFLETLKDDSEDDV